MSSADMQITHPSSSPVRSAVALRLAGEIDASNAQDLSDALEAAIEEGGGPILLDVRELTFIDSTGVHVMVQAAQALNDRGCLVFHGEQRQLSRLLDLLGVDDMVGNLHRVHRDEDARPHLEDHLMDRVDSQG